MNTTKLIGLYYLKNRRVLQGDSVMFDIDNTLIDRETLQPFKPIIELLLEAKKMGYKIVILTARPDYYENQVATVNELKRNGITYNTLGYCSAEKKSDTKKYLQTTGHRFVLSVGDYWTDLTDSSEWLKLPDENEKYFMTSIASHSLSKLQMQSLVRQQI